MLDAFWVTLPIIAMVVVSLNKPNAFCRGRLLSRPLWSLFPSSKPIPVSIICRIVQMVGALSVAFTLEILVGWDATVVNMLYGLALLALWLDDWFTGDDDERKRRWEAVKNKVKWLMVLPRPVPQGTA